MEPSRIGDETLHQARKRSFRAILKDPLTWVMLVLCALTWIRSQNTGVGMAYDAEEMAWSLSSAKWSFLPGVTKDCGSREFVACLVLFVLFAAARNALGKAARSAFVLTSFLLVGAFGIVLEVLYFDGNALAHGLSTFSLANPHYLGAVFGVAFVLGTASLGTLFERRWYRLLLPASVGFVGTGVGLFVFSPIQTQVVFLAAEVLVFLNLFIYARQRLSHAGEFKLTVFFGSSVALAVVIVLLVLPPEVLKPRVAAWKQLAFLPETLMAPRAVLSEIAMKVWKGHPWLGTGLGSFPLDLRFTATAADWHLVTPLQRAVPNGYWNLLAERGIVGAFMMALPLALLLWTWLRRLVRGGLKRFCPHPLALGGLFVLVAALTETMVDTSFFEPGLMMAVGLGLTVAAGAFPKEKVKDGQ